MFGEHRKIGKSIHYEEAIRVPLFIMVPELERQTLDHLVINNDLASTIAEFAGVEPDISVDGFSLIPILNEPSQKLREGFLVEQANRDFGFLEAVRGANFLYVEYSVKANYTEFTT